LRMRFGSWRVESGEWRVESGEWRVESGEWRGVASVFDGLIWSARRLCIHDMGIRPPSAACEE
ncbi:MAG: hypothetical protein ACXVA9_02565, partial [Bdellovibrionales bacterium]